MMSYSMTADQVYGWYYDEEPKRIVGIEPTCSAWLGSWTCTRKRNLGAVPAAVHGAKLTVCFI